MNIKYTKKHASMHPPFQNFLYNTSLNEMCYGAVTE